jgi:hypothetical protein
MNPLKIEIADNQQAFVPGSVLRGTVHWGNWAQDREPSLRLLWYTEGKGTEDLAVVETRSLGHTPGGTCSFEFKLPIGPYSFSGHLISLIWALELQVAKQWVRKEFTLSPTQREIILSDLGQ